MGFVIDAWLGNRDSIGLVEDNVGVNKAGTVIRVDQGGTLEYRAQGGKKQEGFTAEVGEYTSLRDPAKNAAAANIFKSMTPAELAASAKLLESIPNQLIYQRVEEAGLDKVKIGNTLLNRKFDVLEKVKAEIGGAAPHTATTAAPPKIPVAPKEGGTPITSVADLTPDQKKAMSTLAVTHIQSEGIKEVATAIQEFNIVWSGKQLTTLEGVNEKVKQYKDLVQKVQSLKIAKAGEKDKEINELFGTPEAKEHLEVLAKIAGADPLSLKKAHDALKEEYKKILTPTDAGYIQAYTGYSYKEINRALRSNSVSVDQYKYVKGLNAALDKLPEYKGVLYRKADLPFNVVSGYQPGQIVFERAFTSTAKDKKVWSGEYQYIIEESFSGRDVQKISSQGESEYEVIFKANTEFIVTKREGKLIYMKEMIL
jgi:hypothetical protein